MASAVSFLEKESSTGSHMLDWPEQYHMSPKTTPVSVSVALPEQPVHVAVIVYSVGVPPLVAGVGLRRAFHVVSGVFHGFQPAMSYGGHASFAHGRTPNAPPYLGATGPQPCKPLLVTGPTSAATVGARSAHGLGARPAHGQHVRLVGGVGAHVGVHRVQHLPPARDGQPDSCAALAHESIDGGLRGCRGACACACACGAVSVVAVVVVVVRA